MWEILYARKDLIGFVGDEKSHLSVQVGTDNYRGGWRHNFLNQKKTMK